MEQCATCLRLCNERDTATRLAYDGRLCCGESCRRQYHDDSGISSQLANASDTTRLPSAPQ